MEELTDWLWIIDNIGYNNFRLFRMAPVEGGMTDMVKHSISYAVPVMVERMMG